AAKGTKRRRGSGGRGRNRDFQRARMVMTPKRALIFLITISTVARLIVASVLGLGNDEAYHLLYALNPAPSYYDHPPMVAWIEMLGMFGLGNSASSLALRSGFVLLFAGSTWLMWRIASRWFGDWPGFY